jgi:putative aminopeptidase FrvX
MWRLFLMLGVLLGSGQAAPPLEVSLLETLCNAFGPSGFEEEVQRIVRDRGEKFADEVLYDKTGSVIFKKVGDAKGPKIMLAGHADEIGFVITGIDADGVLRFHQLGGWSDQVLLAQEVLIRPFSGGKKVIGIIGAKPPHLLSPEESAKVVTKDSMYIDIGCKSKKEVMDLGIRIGDPAVPYAFFRQMERVRASEKGGGEEKAFLAVAKAFDDRVGVFIGLEVLRRLSEQKIAHPNTVYVVSTTQEEVGMRGAKTAAQLIEPDLGFALDVDISFDVPGATDMNQKMGAGASISAGDGFMIPNPKLRRFVLEIAQQKGIKHQDAFLKYGGTDAGVIHLTGAGAPSLFIGVPTRHIHSHHGMLDLGDVENVIELLMQVIPKLSRETVDGFTRISNP